MSSKQLNSSPCCTQLEGFLSFCLPESLPQPRQQLCLGRGGFTSTTAVLQQPCTQSSSPAGSSLAGQRMLPWQRCPLGHLTSPGWPLLPREPAGTALRGTAAPPELCRLGSPGTSAGWIFGFVLPVLLPSLPGFIRWLGIGRTWWVNKELLRMRSSSSST